jgi:ABC-type methionine transport system ATPase subunit
MIFNSDPIASGSSAERGVSSHRAVSGASVQESAHRIRQRIQIQIPSQYAREPVISTLTTRYGLDVNILSALLATNSRESGWFDLELHGIPARIEAALAYLTQLRIEVLTDDAAVHKSWSFR